MQCAQLAHDKQRAFIVESHVRRYRKLGFSPAPQGYDVYIEFASDIELAYALTDPCGRNIDLEDAVAVVDLDIIENMICSVTDGGPFSNLLFGINNLVGAVSEQKFCLNITLGTRDDLFCAELLSNDAVSSEF